MYITTVWFIPQSREDNEDRDSSVDEDFKDVEELMETAMSLKERRLEYRKLLGGTGQYLL